MGKEANAAKRAAAVAKAAAAKAELAAAEQEAVEAGEPEAESAGTAAALLPMFAGVEEEGVLRIDVTRNEPIDEGLVGHLPPTADEDAIKRRFGGGVFEIAARATTGRILKRRTITLGGEPRFESEDAARRYAIKMGKLPDSKAPAVVTPQGPSFAELMSWMQTSHQQTVEMMRLQVTAAEAAAEERRRRDREDQREREDRLRRDNEDARQRDREHQAAMLQMMKRDDKAGDPMTFITLLTKGLELGRDLGGGGGGEGNPLTTFLANLPAMMERGTAMLRAGADASRAHHQLAPVAPAAAAPAGQKVALTGTTAEKMRRLMALVQARGANPVEVLEHTLDQLAAQVEAVPVPAADGQTAAGATAAGGGAAPADVPAPPPPRAAPRRTDPGNGTPARARATAGR